jgi:excisionase family DNA binding protein
MTSIDHDSHDGATAPGKPGGREGRSAGRASSQPRGGRQRTAGRPSGGRDGIAASAAQPDCPPQPATGAGTLAVSMKVAAEMLSLGFRKVWELCNRGEMRAVHVGRRVIIPVAEVHRWLEDRLAQQQGRCRGVS